MIEYYEKLFFDVRDRLECRDWIWKVIVGPRSTFRDNKNGVMTVEERGYVYRLFAYFGGPLVLDGVVNGMVSKTMPRCVEEVPGWCDDTLNLIVRISGATAAATLRFNQQNMMQMLRLAVRTTAAKAATRDTVPRPHFEEWAEQALASIEDCASWSGYAGAR